MIALLGALALAICYAPIWAGMYTQWITDEDMGHGFLVPLAAAWIVWRERDRWSGIPLHPDARGLAILALGALLHLGSVLGAGLFAGSLALLITLAGMIVAIAGFPLLRAWAFPLLLLVFMLPKLAVVYNQVTLPMQLLASRMAAALLTTAGVATLREGNILDIGGNRILVAEACSGIRYLLPLGFSAVVLGYLAESRMWIRMVLFVLAVPVSIGANAIRVAAVGSFPALLADTPHALAGWVLFVFCLALLELVRRLLSHATLSRS